MSNSNLQPKYPLCTRCGKPITAKQNPKGNLVSIHTFCLEANNRARKRMFKLHAMRYRGAKK